MRIVRTDEVAETTGSGIDEASQGSLGPASGPWPDPRHRCSPRAQGVVRAFTSTETITTKSLSDSCPEQLIRIANPDEPIHRIFPLWFLEETVRLRQLVLTAPHLWDDPLEIVAGPLAVSWRESGRYMKRIINQSLPAVHAQCWSMSAESDTLLRAYSHVIKDPHFHRNICPRDEGVRVRSTPNKLLRALMLGSQSGSAVTCFVGSVQYLEEKALFQEIANAVDSVGIHVFELPGNRARLLLMKREAFAHEAEVRLIAVHQKSEAADPLFRVGIDPNEVFDEMTFDPRLEIFERRERETLIRELGYTGPFRESGLYERVLLEVGLSKPPKAVSRTGGKSTSGSK